VVGLREKFRKIFAGAQVIEPGIYHYRRELNDRQLRLHLRVDPDGQGLLSVNAAGVLHLNATAAELVKHILDGKAQDDAVRAVRKVYRAKREDVLADYQRISKLIQHLETTEDACPIMNVDLPSVPVFGREVSAPYRADLALSYQCNNKCQHCYVARGADEKQSLSLEEWKRVIQKFWDVGVPHICFTGGEATLSPHLVELIERAEDIGAITGLLTNGRKLAERDFVRRLCAAGLDHVQITLESHDAKVHDEMVGLEGAWQETVQGIRNAIDDDIYLVTNTTLCSLNIAEVEKTLEFLKELGVRQFAMNSIIYTGKAPQSSLGIEETELEPLLGLITAKADELGLRFIWYSPTHYCKLNPTMHGLGYKRCTAAEYNICVEPDGAVIPCQSYYQPVGNILTDDWKSIWQSPLFREIRGRDAVSDDCRECPDFEVCGSGCPLSSGDRFLCTDSSSEG
jgi:radical SAM protein with 4Fe4S-binding SPASM domain